MLENPEAEKQREAFAQFGQDIPDSLWPPDFIDGAAAWYSAFWELSSDRQVGMVVGPIQYISIRFYTAGWPPDETTLFTRCIRAMDQVYLEHASSDAEEKSFSRDMFRGAFAGK